MSPRSTPPCMGFFVPDTRRVERANPPKSAVLHAMQPGHLPADVWPLPQPPRHCQLLREIGEEPCTWPRKADSCGENIRQIALFRTPIRNPLTAILQKKNNFHFLIFPSRSARCPWPCATLPMAVCNVVHGRVRRCPRPCATPFLASRRGRAACLRGRRHGRNTAPRHPANANAPPWLRAAAERM